MSPDDVLKNIQKRQRRGPIREPWEMGGEDCTKRGTLRGYLQLSRKTVQERAQEIAEMIADDWRINEEFFPFEQAPDDHPLKPTAHLIGFKAVLTPQGQAQLIRLAPNLERHRQQTAVREAEKPEGNRWLELSDNEPSGGEIPRLVVPEDKKHEGDYVVNGKLDIREILEFLSLLEHGLLTYQEMALAADIAKFWGKLKPGVEGALAELAAWDNHHGQEWGGRDGQPAS